MDPGILSRFADSEHGFMMEVCNRTAMDKKGGHLAVDAATNKLLLREVAQCHTKDMPYFENYVKHRYFNTNNLWIKLNDIKKLLDADQLKLPVMVNHKTVDPKDKRSTRVEQLEVAMGAAISLFPTSTAVEVNRLRFIPVKKCQDLLVLRSDVYRIRAADHHLELMPGVEAAPVVSLDDNFKLMSQCDASMAVGVPSLRNCTLLVINGPVKFGPAVKFLGKVKVVNRDGKTHTLPFGEYTNKLIDMTGGGFANGPGPKKFSHDEL
eukprot:TRINITY_DN17739_c0_g1_i10.p1 TRINITY_DN17739_c0_g1~~TRINITY_DN17739_c0_g1_i10.p1  ORF type:complete len:265 (-),score=78.40 TRINITY_DN17739_c0_g1_i10:159-953(-)